MYAQQGFGPWAHTMRLCHLTALSDGLSGGRPAPKGPESHLIPGGGINISGGVHIHGDVGDLAEDHVDKFLGILNRKIKDGITHNLGAGDGTLSSPFTSGLGVNR